MPNETNPTTITIHGRLSYPVWSHAEAVARNAKSDYPAKDAADVSPEFNILVTEAQLKKFITHVKDIFLPWAQTNFDNGETRNALEPKMVQKLIQQLETGDWEDQPPYIPIKPVPEKSASLAPEAVASIKVKGPRGMDIQQRAIVNDEGELAVPDDKIIRYPVIMPINKTVHSMYGGCNIATTLQLYTFMSGKLPGYSASAAICVFKSDNERFGGGISIDEDAVFLDD